MEFTGWLLDVYASPQDGATLWLLDERDGSRRRLRCCRADGDHVRVFLAHGKRK